MLNCLQWLLWLAEAWHNKRYIHRIVNPCKGCASIVISVSVSLPEYLRTDTFDLYKTFCGYCPWPWICTRYMIGVPNKFKLVTWLYHPPFGDFCPSWARICYVDWLSLYVSLVTQNRHFRRRSSRQFLSFGTEEGLATLDLLIKFGVCISTHYECMKGVTICGKWGGLVQLGVTRSLEIAPFDRVHTSSY